MRSFTLIFLICFTCLGHAQKEAQKADQAIVKVKTITGSIRPKSIVHNGNGLFFAQNMMYRHTVTVYNRQFELVKSLSDEVKLSDFGFSASGKHKGSPVEAAHSPDGRYMWVSNYQMYGKGFNKPGSDNCVKSSDYDKSFVYKIDSKELHIVKILRAGCIPKHLACSPDGRFLLVSNWCSGDVSIFDAEADSLITSLDVGRFPRGVAIDSDSRYAYIAVMGSAKIARIDLGNFSVSYIKQVGRTPRHICLSPDDQFLYVSLNGEGKVKQYALSNLTRVKEVKTAANPRSMVLSPQGEYLYVVNYSANSFSKIRTSDLEVIQHVKTNTKPIGITLDADNQQIWVSCYTGSIMVFKDHGMEEAVPVPLFTSLKLTPRYPSLFNIFSPFSTKIQRPKLTQQQKLKPEKIAPPKKISPPAYCIVLGSFKEKDNAQQAQQKLLAQGLTTQIRAHERGNRITYGAFDDKISAESALANLKQEGWILKLATSL